MENKALVKMDAELKKKIKIKAAEKDMKMQDAIDEAIRQYLAKDD